MTPQQIKALARKHPALGGPTSKAVIISIIGGETVILDPADINMNLPKKRMDEFWVRGLLFHTFPRLSMN